MNEKSSVPFSRIGTQHESKSRNTLVSNSSRTRETMLRSAASMQNGQFTSRRTEIELKEFDKPVVDIE